MQVEKGNEHCNNACLLRIAVSSQASHQNPVQLSIQLYGFMQFFQLSTPMPLASIFPHLHCGHMQPGDLPTLSCRNALVFPLFAERQFGHSKHMKGERHHL